MLYFFPDVSQTKMFPRSQSHFTNSTSTSSPFERMLTVSVAAVLSMKLSIIDEPLFS